MFGLLTQFFDMLFPLSGEAAIVRDLNERTVHTLFTLHDERGIISLSMYTDPRVRALIHEAKFHSNERAWMLLGILLDDYLNQRQQPLDSILPIPLSSTRRRARGYNQVVCVLDSCAQQRPLPTRNDILVRTRDTHAQTSLARSKRLVNVHGAFGAVHGESITGTHIIILDDVTTTGATLRAAKEALRPYNPASITLLAIAH